MKLFSRRHRKPTASMTDHATFTGRKYQGSALLDSAWGASDSIDIATLRAHSHRAYTRNSRARALIECKEAAVIGAGLELEAHPIEQVCNAIAPNYNLQDWAQSTETLWRLWADQPASDYSDIHCFNALQSIAYRDLLLNGKALAILRISNGMLSIQLVNVANQIATHFYERTDAYYSAGGMRIDRATGKVLGYYLVDDPYAIDEPKHDHTRPLYIPRYSPTGDTWIVDITASRIAGDIEGCPVLAPVLDDLTLLEKYSLFELHSALINASIATSTESEHTPGINPIPSGKAATHAVAAAQSDETEYREMKPGWMIAHAYSGMRTREHDTKRPNAQFSQFEECISRTISAATGIPCEVYKKQFVSSYSASRAALLEFWREVERERVRFAREFLRPIYTAWLANEARTGRIYAPQFDQPTPRAAWSNSTWYGAGRGHIDPLKEIQAIERAIHSGLTTAEQAARQHFNTDYFTNADRRKAEMDALPQSEPPAPPAVEREDKDDQ